MPDESTPVVRSVSRWTPWGGNRPACEGESHKPSSRSAQGYQSRGQEDQVMAPEHGREDERGDDPGAEANSLVTVAPGVN